MLDAFEIKGVKMPTELPAESVALIATIIAALIAAAFSFVNLTLTKEQKTSEFRQAWIDALRQDLATFFATVRAFARAAQARVGRNACGSAECIAQSRRTHNDFAK